MGHLFVTHSTYLCPLHIHSQCQFFILQWVSTFNRGHLWLPLGTIHKRHQDVFQFFERSSANFDQFLTPTPSQLPTSFMDGPLVCIHRRWSVHKFCNTSEFPLGTRVTAENFRLNKSPKTWSAPVNLLHYLFMRIQILFNWNYFLCTGGDDKDACQGDSGGPLGTVWSLVRGLTIFISKGIWS